MGQRSKARATSMNWTAGRRGVQPARSQRLHVQVARAVLGQPAAGLDREPADRRAARRDPRMAGRDRPRVTRSRADRSRQRAAARSAARRHGNGNYIEALGGDGATGWDWIINAFTLARQYFPNAKLMLNDYSITNDGNATDELSADHQAAQGARADRCHRRPGARVLDHRAAPMPTHTANLDRLAADRAADLRDRAGHRRQRRMPVQLAQLPAHLPGVLGEPEQSRASRCGATPATAIGAGRRAHG